MVDKTDLKQAKRKNNNNTKKYGITNKDKFCFDEEIFISLALGFHEVTFANFLHPLFIPHGERSGLSGLWVQKTQHAHLSHFLFSGSICLQDVHTHCPFGRGLQLPTFARDWWVSSIQGEALGNPWWLHVCHALQSYISYQVDIAISIHLLPVSKFQLVLNSRGEKRGYYFITFLKSQCYLKKKKKNIGTYDEVLRGKYNLDGGGCGMKK